MTIYLGSSGHVELQRPTTEWMRTTVNDPDINVNQRRFSVNFYGDQDGAATLMPTFVAPEPRTGRRLALQLRHR